MEPAMKNRRLFSLLIAGSLVTVVSLTNTNGLTTGRPSDLAPQPTEADTPSEGNQDPTAGSLTKPIPNTTDSERIKEIAEELEWLKVNKADSDPFLPVSAGLISFAALLASLLALLSSFITYYQHRRSASYLIKKIKELKGDAVYPQYIEKDSNCISENLDSLSATSQTFNLTKTTDAQTPDPPTSLDAKLSTPNPFPTSISTPAPVTPSTSKTGLVSALNNGDRQQLRDAASAELNITDESENAIATGRSQATQLEEVSGGGSYWLICLNNQYWLFPTQRTLKGYTTAQPAKGLFQFEKKALSQAQLIEPACLERTGITWTVTSLGRIGTP